MAMLSACVPGTHLATDTGGAICRGMPRESSSLARQSSVLRSWKYEPLTFGYELRDLVDISI